MYYAFKRSPRAAVEQLINLHVKTSNFGFGFLLEVQSHGTRRYTRMDRGLGSG